MKRFVLILGMLLCAVAVFAGGAYAAGNTDVTVNAAVLGSCSYSLPALGATVINLGTLDPAAGGAVNGSQTMVGAIQCTKGQTFTVTLGGGSTGANNLVGPQPATTDNIPYTPSYTTSSGGTLGLGFGAGTAIDLTITVDVLAGSYANASVGGYVDTFTVDITP